jgi:hypothetical protein
MITVCVTPTVSATQPAIRTEAVIATPLTTWLNPLARAI